MAQPVPFWDEGTTDVQVDAATAAENGRMVLDLGESWTPYLFTEQTGTEEDRVPHAYRATYLALARGEIPDDHHGRRASRDKYLELFGIMPTLGLLRERFRTVTQLECAEELDLEPLVQYEGFIRYHNNRQARRNASHYAVLERHVASHVEAQGVNDESALDLDALEAREAREVREYRNLRPQVLAVRSAQDRLRCEGYYGSDPDYLHGQLDWETHEALAEFERRHRVYGWGYIGLETLERLRMTPEELEQEAVIRILTERAMHALGALEDGSAPDVDGEPPTYRGADGLDHPIPNLEQQVREQLISALGLQTPESALDFLESLGELTPDAERFVAIPAPDLPEYYANDMEIRIEIDRGDVWYEFPYDEEGHERSQSVSRRPRQTIIVEYLGQSIPIARFGTTVGGWRSEQIDGTLMWRYKNSPVGARVWHQIVSAPVWMPPGSTPARSLLVRRPGRSGAQAYAVNHHETGPSYASAYGLVAAYHRQFSRNDDGSVRIRGDEGIRSHGSVDYMSIMRRHSHGCHRLHNHIAVRLMSWVLAHRRHRRVGHHEVGFHRLIEHEEFTYELDIERGGYVFDLDRPVPVRVLEGRIRGTQATPIVTPLPRFNEEAGAYILPDGGAVRIGRSGEMTPYELAPPDGGVPLPGTEGAPPVADPAALLNALPLPAVRPAARPATTPTTN